MPLDAEFPLIVVVSVGVVHVSDLSRTRMLPSPSLRYGARAESKRGKQRDVLARGGLPRVVTEAHGPQRVESYAPTPSLGRCGAQRKPRRDLGFASRATIMCSLSRAPVFPVDSPLVYSGRMNPHLRSASLVHQVCPYAPINSCSCLSLFYFVDFFGAMHLRALPRARNT